MKSIKCFFFGHPVVRTGRHGRLLFEVKCSHCNKLFIATREPDHAGLLLPYTKDVEPFFTKKWNDNLILPPK